MGPEAVRLLVLWMAGRINSRQRNYAQILAVTRDVWTDPTVSARCRSYGASARHAWERKEACLGAQGGSSCSSTIGDQRAGSARMGQ